MGSTSFKREFEMPLKSLGKYIAYQATIGYEATYFEGAKGVGISLLQQNQTVAVEIEKKLSESFKIEGGVEFDEAKENALREAVKSRSTKKFAEAFAKMLKLEVAVTPGHKPLGLSLEAGAEMSKAPAFCKASGEYTQSIRIGPTLMPVKIAYSLQLNVGPSEEGWKRIVRTLSREAVKAFLKTVAWSWLRAWGVEAFAVVVASGTTVAIVAAVVAAPILGLYEVARRREDGVLIAYAYLYAHAYVAKVYDEDLPTYPAQTPEDVKMHASLIKDGEAHAVSHARRVLSETKDSQVTPGHPVALQLKRYGQILNSVHGDRYKAERALRKYLQPIAFKRLKEARDSAR